MIRPKLYPLCNCHLPTHCSYKIVEQRDDICTNCGHYVFWGTAEDYPHILQDAPRKKRYSKEVREQAIKLYKSNHNIYSIGEQLGVRDITVKKWLNQANIKVSSKKRFTEADVEKYRKLYKKCGNLSHVARHNNIHINTLQKWKKKYGW